MMDSLPAKLPIDESSIRYAGWRAVIVCFLMATFAWGFAFYGQAVYVAEFQRLYGWPASLVATATSAFYLGGALLVVFVSDAIRVIGLKPFLLCGVGFMAAASLAISYVSTPFQLYAAYALLSCGWAGMSIGAITNTLGMYFSSRRGLAISLALNGASIGGVIGVPLMVIAIQSYGFQATMQIGTMLVLTVMIPAILLGMGHPPAQLQASGAAASQPPLSSTAVRAAAFRSLPFWTISLPFALVLFSQVSFIVHQISYMDPLIGRERAALAVGLMTLAAVVGRVGLGFFIDRIDQRKASSALFVSQGLALIVMINVPTDIALIAGSFVFGLTVGNAITLPALIIQREFDPRSFGILVSLVTAINQVTYAFGPGLIGILRDLSGNYGTAFYVNVVLEFAAAAIVLIRGRAPEPVKP